MELNLFPLLFVVALVVVQYFIATKKDVEKFKDPRTRGQVVEVFRKNMTDLEITKVYLKTNLRELTLFLGGMAVGVVMWIVGGN